MRLSYSKVKRWQARIASGDETGKGEERSTPQVSWCGRSVHDTYEPNVVALHNAHMFCCQLNDCWPVTSWALVDYFLRPKPVFFSVARELRPVTVGLARYEKKGPGNPRSAAVQSQFFVAAWATNATLEPVSVSTHDDDTSLENKIIESGSDR